MREVYLKSISDIFNFLNQHGNDKPLSRILLSIKRQCHAGIIIEVSENYMVPEIAHEMQILAFPKNIKATRLDFYNAKLSLNGNREKGNYLGYVVLRPESPITKTKTRQRVGDTIIETPKDKGKLQYFLTCQAKIPVGSNKKNLITYPFFQQHWSNRWKCGFATLRMFSKWLKYKTNNLIEVDDNYKDISFPQIDNLLERKKVSVFTNDDFKFFLGLTVLKYEYNNPDKKPTWSPEQIVYSYVESGLPVFILFGTESNDPKDEGHIVSVIGHTFNPDAWWPEAEKAYYSRILKGKPGYLKSIAWVDFIIHDDNYGPFLTMPRDFLKINPELYQPPWYLKHLPLKQQRKFETERIAKIRRARVLEIIIPFIKGVNIVAEEAEAIAFKTLTSKNLWDVPINSENYNTSTKKWRQLFDRYLDNEHLVLRTFLIKFSELSKVFPKKIGKLNENIKRIFHSEKMGAPPELVWFVEASIPDLFTQERYRLGEVIVDAKYSMLSSRDFSKAVRYAHLPGIQLGFNEGKVKARLFVNEEPYHHLIR